MDDVGVEVVVAGGNCGQRQRKFTGCDGLGMEVEDDVHLRPANRVEMHEVVVVGDEAGEGVARTEPAWVFDFEVEDVAGGEGRVVAGRGLEQYVMAMGCLFTDSSSVYGDAAADLESMAAH